MKYFLIGLAVLAVLVLAAGRYVADALRWVTARRTARPGYAY